MLRLVARLGPQFGPQLRRIVVFYHRVHDSLDYLTDCHLDVRAVRTADRVRCLSLSPSALQDDGRSSYT